MENSLLSKHPEIAAQWHPSKNGSLTPEDVTYASMKKVWWRMPYDDPRTGRHFDFEWVARISERTRDASHASAPFLSGRALWKGYNDLATISPEQAAKWHPTKNGELKPDAIPAHSHKKYWWIYPYDDPRTGRHFDFEWEMSPDKMLHENIVCPFFSGQVIWPGYNDLASLYPDIASQWHPTKNGSLTPVDVTSASTKKVWWLMPYDDPETGRHFDFEWIARISDRTKKHAGPPFLQGKAVWPGYNDLASVAPEQAAKWHPTKNGALTPAEVLAGSNTEYWWIYPYDDPRTGRHFDFEWQMSPHRMVNSHVVCPYLAGAMVWPGFNDLHSLYPEVAAQWHPTKNGTLTPENTTYGSKKEVWWLLPYDDPETGRHYDFEWTAKVYTRTRKPSVTPLQTKNRVWQGYNDLASAAPEQAAKWHPIKNGELKPDKVSANSQTKYWWLYPYDDPKTGRHFDFEWQMSPYHMVSDNVTCPFLDGTMAWPGFNDLASLYPKVAKQWHPTRNGAMTPENTPYNSKKEVWWLLSYDDPATGQHYNFEWLGYVYARTTGHYGCPFLSGRRVFKGFNDLATRRPDIAALWHPTKNGTLTPDQVTEGSRRSVTWLYVYDDPKTGEQQQVEWVAKIEKMTKSKDPLAFLNSQDVKKAVGNLAVTHPEIANQWHPTKNGNLKPTDVTYGSMVSVWWYLPYDDPKTGRHFDFEWKTSVNNRTNQGNGCPYLSGRGVWKGFNDLETLRPDLARQWHPTKNGDKAPCDFTVSSWFKAWWLLPYDDPKTGQHFDFEWQSSIADRNAGKGCPYLSGKSVMVGFNDLQTLYPEIAAQWHPTKNGHLTPTTVSYASARSVWWYLPYDDPTTSRHFIFEWKTSVANRTRLGLGCPYLTNDAVWPGYNDLASTHPEIAAQWHPTKNGHLTPYDVVAGSPRRVWWFLPYNDPHTGKHFDFEWATTVTSRTSDNSGCPYLNNSAVWPGYNDLLSQKPEIAQLWHPTKNKEITPDTVLVSTPASYWWHMPYDDPKTGKHYDFEWKASVMAVSGNKTPCPYLRNDAVWPGFNDLASQKPEVAMLWHPYKNKNVTPDTVLVTSNASYWWFMSYDDPKTGKHHDFEWRASVKSFSRNKVLCPYLRNDAVWPGFNDLASQKPEVAMLWHPYKNKDVTPDTVLVTSNASYWWFMSYDDPKTGKHHDFEWRASVKSFSRNKVLCPYLRNDAVWPGFNDLASCYPNIAEEWYISRNHKKDPSRVFKASVDKYWWACSTCGHEWYATVKSRTIEEQNCPVCAKEKRRRLYTEL